MNKRYLDFSSLLVFGHLPSGWPEAALAQIVQLMFSGVLGAIFVYLLDIISTRYLYFKSAVYAMAIWFSAYGIPKVLALSLFKHMNFQTALSHLFTSLAEGVVVAFILTKVVPEEQKAKEE